MNKNQNRDLNSSSMIVSSYLKKLKGKGARARFLSKFTTRWFVLDLNLGLFYYTKRQSDKKQIESHRIEDIIFINRNPTVSEISD